MDINELLAEYNQQLPLYDAFRKSLQSLIGQITQEDKQVLSVASRVKSLLSLKEKLSIQGAKSLSHITDLVGIRIVVSDQNGVDDTLQKIMREFLVETHSVNKWKDEPRYQSVHLIVSISPERVKLPEWSAFKGFNAEIQIRTALAQALAEVEHQLSYKLATVASSTRKIRDGIEATDKLSRIISKFESLLGKPDVHEKRDIHPFLDKHRFILYPNPKEIFSEVPIGLGTEYQMDFLIRQPDGEYVLTEIENPRHKLFTKGGDFTAPVNHAQRQVEDWQNWIEDNISTMQRTYPGIISPRGRVIIGRSNSLLPIENRRLQRRNINLRGRLEIITYDELIASARTYVESIRTHL